MKYLSKTFVDTIHEWTPEQLVFNAVAWDNGTVSSVALVTFRRQCTLKTKKKKKIFNGFPLVCRDMDYRVSL